MGCQNSRIDDLIEPEIIQKKEVKKNKKKEIKRPVRAKPLANAVKSGNLNLLKVFISMNKNV